eukprot:m.6840 g.6840  ORF g.6840 m.6840 type:complete len:102 (+) comp17011_c0_seq1:229-534(+)
MTRRLCCLTNLRHCLNIFKEAQNDLPDSVDTSYKAPIESTSAPGRPRFVVSREQLEYFVELQFTATAMADMLGVSLRTFVVGSPIMDLAPGLLSQIYLTNS